MTHGILIIEDEATLAQNIGRYLQRYGYETHVSETGEAGLDAFEAFKPDLVLLDYRLPGLDGLETLVQIRKRDPCAKVILTTGVGGISTAVNAIKRGAYAYVTKPIVMSELKVMIDKAVGQQHLEKTLSYYRERESAHARLSGLLGDSPVMEVLKRWIRHVIGTDSTLATRPPSPVLITGEAGVGKKTVARIIHFNGPRRDRSFVQANCASIPAQRAEAVLFGYERAAFSDAREAKPGLVEAADGGTLFLDEVDRLLPGAQVKLFNYLENRTVERLGGPRRRRLNLRVLVSTNRSIDALIQEGEFHAGLYHRLREISVSVPPLRERDRDVVLLAEDFLSEFKRRYEKPMIRFGPAAEKALMNYCWPGNLRELRNVVEQAALLSLGDVIHPQQLSLLPAEVLTNGHSLMDTIDAGEGLPPEGVNLTDIERNLVMMALNDSAWNVTGAARLLGLSRDTLRYRIEKHSLKRPA